MPITVVRCRPGLNNCVGWGNYQYFWCFLLWLTVATLYVSLAAAPVVYRYERESVAEGVRAWLARPSLLERTRTNIANVMTLLAVFMSNEFGSDQGKGLLAMAAKIKSVSSPSSATDVTQISELPAIATLIPLDSMRRRLTSFVTSSVFMMNPVDMLLHSAQLKQLFLDTFNERVIVLMTEVFCVSLFVAVGFLFSFHVYLACTAQTTLELFENHSVRRRMKENGLVYKSPFDTGNSWDNLKQVLGPNPIITILWPGRKIPPPPLMSRYRLTGGDVFFDSNV